MYELKNKKYDLFDDLFDFPYSERRYTDLMKTDIEEYDDSYHINVEVPSVKKEDVKISLEDGYLTISIEKKNNNDLKDKTGKVIHKERYFGSIKRSYNVGDVKEEDISAKLENGLLTVVIKKPEPVKEEEKRKYIDIQ